MKNTTTKATRCAALALLALGCGAAGAATQYGKVISATPVTERVAVPQQVCTDEQQLVQPRTSGAGALVGALIGGAVGNSVGGGSGKALATGLGLVAGAAVGDHVESGRTPAAMVPVRRCHAVTQYENRLVGYDVVYEYAGQRYGTRTHNHPGRHIALDVNVVPAEYAAPPVATMPAPVYVPPATAYAPAYPATVVYPAPVYVAPPVVVSGHWHPHRHHHHHHHHHGHWR